MNRRRIINKIWISKRAEADGKALVISKVGPNGVTPEPFLMVQL